MRPSFSAPCLNIYESVFDIRTSGLSLGLPRAFFDRPLVGIDVADADMCRSDEVVNEREIESECDARVRALVRFLLPSL